MKNTILQCQYFSITCKALKKNLSATSGSLCNEKQLPTTHHVCGQFLSTSTNFIRRIKISEEEGKETKTTTLIIINDFFFL